MGKSFQCAFLPVRWLWRWTWHRYCMLKTSSLRMLTVTTQCSRRCWQAPSALGVSRCAAAAVRRATDARGPRQTADMAEDKQSIVNSFADSCAGCSRQCWRECGRIRAHCCSCAMCHSRQRATASGMPQRTGALLLLLTAPQHASTVYDSSSCFCCSERCMSTCTLPC